MQLPKYLDPNSFKKQTLEYGTLIKRHDFTIGFFDIFVFLFIFLATDPSFMPLLYLVLWFVLFKKKNHLIVLRNVHSCSNFYFLLLTFSNLKSQLYHFNLFQMLKQTTVPPIPTCRKIFSINHWY